MTRKDYIVIANAIKGGKEALLIQADTVGYTIADKVQQEQVINTIVNRLAINLYADNHKFSPEKFRNYINS